MSESPLSPEALLEHQDWMRGLVRRLVKDENRVDDVLQETWLRLLESPPKHSNALRSWFATVARRLVRDTDRAEAGRARRERGLAVPEARPSTHEFVEHETARRRVSDAVLGLREPYRSVVILRYYEGLPPRHVARRLGVPVASVRSQLRRAHEELRRRLDREYGGDRRSWCLALIPLVWPPSLLWRLTARAKFLLDRGGMAIGNAMAIVAMLLVAFFALRWLDVLNRPDTVAVPAHSAPFAASEAPVAASRPASDLLPQGESTPFATQTSKPEDHYGTLVVRVRWAEDGSPAEDVGVNVIATRAPNSIQAQVRRVTNAEGIVRIEHLVAGPATIRLDRGGNENALVEPGRTKQVDVDVPVGFTVKGAVVDPDSRPVEGAAVWMTEMVDPAWGRVVARSGRDGTFEIRCVSEERYLGVTAKGFSPTDLIVLAAATSPTLMVPYAFSKPGGEFSRRVVDEKGSPISNAAVLIGSEKPDLVFSRDGARPGRKASPVRTATDSDGRFHADGLPLGPTSVAIRAAGFGLWKGTATATSDDAAEVTIRLDVGARVVGVVRGADGRPAGDVRVEACGTGSDFFSSCALTGEDGRFELEDLPAGEISLRAEDESRAIASATLRTTAGGVVSWNPTLSGGLEIVGRVLDEWGAPLARATVTAHAESPTGSGIAINPVQVRTDEQGSFVIRNCRGVSYGLEAMDPAGNDDFPSVSASDVQPGKGDVTLRLSAETRATAYVTGCVVDPLGQPLGRVPVSIGCGRTRNGVVHRTDEITGRFEIGPLPPNRYRVLIESTNFAEVVTDYRDVGRGQTRDFETIRLELPGTLVVTLDGAGSPAMDGSWLSLRDRDGAIAERWTRDATGAFRSRPLRSGRYSLRVNGEGTAFVECSFDIQAGSETERRLTLNPGVAYRFLVRSPETAAPFRTLDFVIRNSEGNVFFDEQRSLSVGANGREVSIGVGLPLGRFEVEAKTETGLQFREPLIVSDVTLPRVVRTLELR